MAPVPVASQVVETYSEELGLGKSDSRHSHAIIAAHGPKKLAAVVAAVRTVQFMDRCAAGAVGVAAASRQMGRWPGP